MIWQAPAQKVSRSVQLKLVVGSNNKKNKEIQSPPIRESRPATPEGFRLVLWHHLSSSPIYFCTNKSQKAEIPTGCTGQAPRIKENFKVSTWARAGLGNEAKENIRAVLATWPAIL